MIERQGVLITTSGATADGELSTVALEAFVVEHYERLLHLARLVCRDTADAADAVQVGLERAWRARATLANAESIKPWLDRIIVREAIRIGKSRERVLRRLFAPSSDVRWIEPVDMRSDIAPAWVALADSFARLPTEQRAALVLHFHAGYSLSEVAAIVGAPMETVRSRIRLAKSRLRAELGGAER